MESLTVADPTVRIAVRPWRYALMVRVGDPDDLGRAIAIASMSWGGVGWPLLPVGPTGAVDPGALSVARAIGVDAVLDMRGTGPVVGWAMPDLPWPVRRPDPEAQDGGLTGDGRCAPPRLVGEQVVLPASGRFVDAAGAGTVDSAAAVQVWRSYGALIREDTAAHALALAQVAGRTAVAVGADAAAASGRGRVGTIGFVWAVPDDADLADVIGFWNVRALRGRGGCAGVVMIADVSTLTSREITDAIRTRVAATTPHDPSCLLLAPRLARDDLITLGRMLGARPIDESAGWGLWKRSTPTGVAVPATTTASTGKLVAHVLPLDPVHPAAIGHGDIALVVRSSQLSAPRRPAVAELYHPRARWTDDGLAVPAVQNASHVVSLDLPEPTKILDAALAARGLSCERSEAGQLAERLIERCGDRTMLRRPGTQTLFAALAAAGESRHLPFRLATLAAAVGLTERQIRSVAGALAAFAADGLVEWSALVECRHCGMTSYRQLDAVRPAVRCDFCAKPAAFALTEAGELAIHHRCHELLVRLCAPPMPLLLAAAVTLATEGAYVTLMPQVGAAGSWQRVDGIGWHGNSLYALVTLAGGTGRPGDLVEWASSVGLDALVLVGEPTGDLMESYQRRAGETGVDLTVLTSDDLVWEPLSAARARPPGRRSAERRLNGRRAVESAPWSPPEEPIPPATMDLRDALIDFRRMM
ncbi:hypothetical protein GCM10009765_26080 [Fodinicola feengrottensis]|uniref:Replication restart DNA helicase PriA n=1 Tax=Fodinicola feengrottensis TaxID=435914 RepID=A0ABN2GRY8_9ACTN